MSSLPQEYLGRWYYTGSSGGITGRGLGDAATGSIVIHANNTIDHHDDAGTLLHTVRFTASRGRTIFSTDDRWILKFGTAVDEVIMLLDDGTSMSLSEHAYDGFARTYARSRGGVSD